MNDELSGKAGQLNDEQLHTLKLWHTKALGYRSDWINGRECAAEGYQIAGHLLDCIEEVRRLRAILATTTEPAK